MNPESEPWLQLLKNGNFFTLRSELREKTVKINKEQSKKEVNRIEEKTEDDMIQKNMICRRMNPPRAPETDVDETNDIKFISNSSVKLQ